MLRLERVEIAGFKSFYEKVDLAFPGRVTAVVGPNGCGKSNICDAVAWALGEQSARVLRGERMDDVIFNGSAKRRPLGMAEVIVTLVSENGNGDPEHGRLRVGRRVFRDGEGEYFLNDKQVRFKDVQDRLLGTGLSVRAYSVIEQGRIDQVLSTKPQDRRRLIEEAAGITKYKAKRKLAEVKLDETRANLLRLSDIVTEVERNCASLKRQASRAARYKEFTEALKVRRAALARVRADVLSGSLASARLVSGEAAAKRDGLRESLALLEAAIARDDERLEANRRATTDLAARRGASEREGRDFSAEESRAGRELADLTGRLERAVSEARTRSLAREETDRKASEALAALEKLEEELEAARTDALRAAGERVAARNARHEVDLAVERLAAGATRLEEGRIKLARELEERGRDLAAAEREEASLRETARAGGETVRQLAAEIAAIVRGLSEMETAREDARASLATLEEREAALVEAARARDGALGAIREAPAVHPALAPYAPSSSPAPEPAGPSDPEKWAVVKQLIASRPASAEICRPPAPTRPARPYSAVA